MKAEEGARLARRVVRIAASYARRHTGHSLVSVPFGHAGAQVMADLSTSMGLRLYRYGLWDDLFEGLHNELSAGDVFIDCGANIGLFTIAAATLVGPTGQVVAFEPAPPAREALERNIDLNGFAQVTVLPYALAERPSTMPFLLMGDSGGLSSFCPECPADGRIVQVTVAALDAVIPVDCWGRIRLMKIDIEGAEVRAFQGADRLLTCERPVLIVEVEDEHLRRQGSSAAALYKLLDHYGYDAYHSNRPSPDVVFRPR